jgi:GDP-L-fucose synthase
MKEEYLLSGPLEPTNQWYAVAKIAGIKMCQAYHQQYGLNAISVMPTNLYGPHDNFDLETSHVLPAMIRKFHDAKMKNEDVTLWGTGSPMREFLHVDDMADACVHLMNNYDDPEIVNIGCGEDLTIKELAETIQEIVGHKYKIIWDSDKPDGAPRKLLDTSRLTSQGWSPKIPLKEGIRSAYEWFCENHT